MKIVEKFKANAIQGTINMEIIFTSTKQRITAAT